MKAFNARPVSDIPAHKTTHLIDCSFAYVVQSITQDPLFAPVKENLDSLEKFEHFTSSIDFKNFKWVQTTIDSNLLV